MIVLLDGVAFVTEWCKVLEEISDLAILSPWDCAALPVQFERLLALVSLLEADNGFDGITDFFLDEARCEAVTEFSEAIRGFSNGEDLATDPMFSWDAEAGLFFLLFICPLWWVVPFSPEAGLLLWWDITDGVSDGFMHAISFDPVIRNFWDREGCTGPEADLETVFEVADFFEDLGGGIIGGSNRRAQ